MAELFLQIAVSLDGYIEGPNGELDWMVHDVHVDPVATATLESIDGMVLGRKAHGILAQFWPDAVENPDPLLPELPKQARLMCDLPKYVLTHGDETHGWVNSHPITVDGVIKLKARARRPVAVFAGARAAHALLAITDEIRLIQYPVLLGAGTRLFADSSPRRSLHRLSTREFPSGAIMTIDRFN